MNTAELVDLGIGAMDAEQAKILATIAESIRREAWEMQTRVQACVEAGSMRVEQASIIACRIGHALQRLDEGQDLCDIDAHLQRTAKMLTAIENGG